MDTRCHGPPPRCLSPPFPPPTWRIRLIAEKKPTSTSRPDPDHLSAAICTRCALCPSIESGRKWHRRNPPSHLFPLMLSARLCQLPCPAPRGSRSGISFVSKFVERKRKYFVSRPGGKLENVLVRENDNWTIYYSFYSPQ